MRLENFSVSWVDLAIVIVLLVGVMRGRKRGMSEEFLDVIKWLLILGAAAYLYQPGGQFLAGTNMFSLLSCYVAVYATVVIGISAFFACVRRRVGGKLVESDVFGGGEFYLGMAAGALRYGCILLVLMAFLNARYYSPEELHARETYQEKNFGSIRFPTLSSLQKEVFERSWLGRSARNHLSLVLIQPTAPASAALGGGARARERSFNEVLDKR